MCHEARLTGVILAGLILVSLAGCEPDGVAVEDNLNFELFSSQLHTPYVVGADMNLSAWRRDGGPVEGWHMRSANEAVFSVGQNAAGRNDDDLDVRGVAVAPGETELEILDARGRIRAVRPIRVELPDRLELVPAGLDKVRPENCPRLDPSETVSVVAGGKATFEVVYSKYGERLYGNGVLALGDGADLGAKNDTTFLGLDREWLVLAPVRTGQQMLPLLVGEHAVALLPVRVVEEADIARVEILAEKTRKAKDGQQFYLLARAFDAAEVEIFGVAFDWQVDGVEQLGVGDLFAYTYQNGAWTDVDASAGDSTGSVSVQMDGGYVTSSNNIGCATAPGRGAGSGLAGLLALTLFVWRRRR